MNSRLAIIVVGVPILLVAPSPAVGSQSEANPVLVDVPIPAYPPIARSAMISGDVHVTVEVRAEGTDATASISGVEGFSREAEAKFFEQSVLEAARNARFRCEQCGNTPRLYSLVFAFRFGYRIGRAAGDLHPEVVSISPSQSRILIVSEGPGPPNGPVALTSPPPRAANCLWLWHCKKHKGSDEGEPELVLESVQGPEYPAAARADMASADVEVKVAVQRSGHIASAEIGTTRKLIGSTQAIESAFQRAALQAARQTTFYCRRCRQGTLPYTLVYAFRFDGVLASLDLGYAASAFTSSPSQARLLVSPDVPILHAALSVRADPLPSACRLAPGQPAAGKMPVAG